MAVVAVAFCGSGLMAVVSHDMVNLSWQSSLSHGPLSDGQKKWTVVISDYCLK